MSDQPNPNKVRLAAEEIEMNMRIQFEHGLSPQDLTYAAFHAAMLVFLRSIKQGGAVLSMERIVKVLMKNAQVFDESGIEAFVVPKGKVH